jgi:small subunit ribosomal protein S13e
MVKGFPAVLFLTFAPHQHGLKLNPKQSKKKSSNLYVRPSLHSFRHFCRPASFPTSPYLAHLVSFTLLTHSINPPHPACHQTTAPPPRPQQQARKGFFPSQIGLVLRDSQAVAQVQAVTGSKILRILKAGGLGPRLPEDLYHMIKKAVTIRKHLSLYRKDKDAKFRLILVESRIHRLARYYRSKRQLPPNWRYDSSNASTLVA